MEDNIETNAELTVEKIAEFALPEDARTMEIFSSAEMPMTPSDFQPLKDYFGVGDVDRKVQEQLNNVWTYFAEGEDNPGKVLKKIKASLANLAQPNMGDTRLNQLNNYIRVLQQLNDAKDMKEAYEK